MFSCGCLGFRRARFNVLKNASLGPDLHRISFKGTSEFDLKVRVFILSKIGVCSRKSDEFHLNFGPKQYQPKNPTKSMISHQKTQKYIKG